MRPSTSFGAYLSNFHSIRPRFEIDQERAFEWLTDSHRRCLPDEHVDSRKLLRRYGCSSSRIARRGHELPDYAHREWEKMCIFGPDAPPRGAGFAKRGEFFDRVAGEILERFYPPSKSPPDDLIHVTCTGFSLPSPAQRLVNQRGWENTTTVTHLYQMGCSASIPALRVGAGLLANSAVSQSRLTGEKHRADIAHTELCTLHFNPEEREPEDFVGQTLFADGHIRYSISSDPPTRGGFEILAIREKILKDTWEKMSWHCRDWGMKMHLSREIPELIGQAILCFFKDLFAVAGFDWNLDRQDAVFAVHPGGPRIIDRTESALELRAAQLDLSRSVLFDYGNMSSSTLPHIWHRILEDSWIPPGTLVPSIAFGPGLTVCGAILRKV